MNASFTIQKFLVIFERINAAMWPLHLVSYGVAAAVLVLVVGRHRSSSSLVYVGLAILWVFAGVVFHWIYFRPVAKAGVPLAILFAAQASIFLVAAYHPRTVFRFDGTLYSWFGLVLVAFSLGGYPTVAYLVRGNMRQAAWIGAFPCPVGLFTLGLFLLTERVVPKFLLVIPTLWAAAGVWPLSLGIVEDSSLVVGGLLASGLILYRDRRPYAREPSVSA